MWHVHWEFTNQLKGVCMSIRLNVPFLFHFQTWQEGKLKGKPFVWYQQERGALYVGGRLFQWGASEGRFLLLETSFLRFQLGSVGSYWPA
ncbi:MAG: hypothetical protein DCC63_13585 [Nitrospira sp.]|nr:MAG: hypothetical protein DCC63_13585 [Nitrospira sp.]